MDKLLLHAQTNFGSVRGMPSRKRVDPTTVPAIAARLVLLQRALTPSAAEFCRQIGLSPQNWTNWTTKEEGRIGIDAAIRICQRWQISLDWIYLGKEGLMPYEVMRKVKALEEATEAAPASRQAS